MELSATVRPNRLVGGLLVVVALVAAGCTAMAGDDTAPGVVRQYSSPARIAHPARSATIPGARLTGVLRAPGGPYLKDGSGRTVFLHGVNAVYKSPPFYLTEAPGKPWNFSAADAASIARLGFNVVRLGIEWQGLEPGAGGPNNAAICTPGHDGTASSMFNAATMQHYLREVQRTVDLLGRYGIYTLLDMHQDVDNQVFRGEGMPAWSICTGDEPLVALGGRWSHNYRNPALDVAVQHFWQNDVVGNLQGQFDQAWGAVAKFFSTNPWIVGYDPYNEPFAPEVTADDTLSFAVELECFYNGTKDPGRLAGDTPVTCPKDDPRRGVIPVIEAADPRHLIFVETDIYSSHNRPSLLGPMDFPNLVLNFHSYCGSRSPVTGQPVDVDACSDQILHTMLRRQSERPDMASRYQRGGPAWFMSEFGANQNQALLGQVADYADDLQLGWTEWAWKYYNDPTGSSDEGMVSPTGALQPAALALSRPYAQAVAGTPISSSVDPDGAFQLAYTPSYRVTGPSIIYVPGRLHFPHGYCAAVSGGLILSVPGASRLLISNDQGASEVTVRVTPGHCP
jgi:endoglycosylceramidase